MWHGVEGHDEVVEQFRRAMERGRLATSFLFVGPEGVGKRTFAVKLAQALLCERSAAGALEPCENCPSCAQVLAGTHPDIERVARPDDKATIPLELLIGPDDRRRREGLCYRLSLKPFMGGRKIAILDDADYLATEGANALLKTLEEPPPNSVLILIGTSAPRQLPTIRSRCQVVRFAALAADTVAALLVKHEVVANRADALRLAAEADGSVRRAMELADPEILAFRTQLFGQLSASPIDSLGIARAIVEFGEASRREGAARRQRLHVALNLAIAFYRRVLNSPAGEVAASAIERTLDAQAHLDRFIAPALVIECWIDDVYNLLTTGTIPART